MELKGNFIILFLTLCLHAVAQDVPKIRIDPSQAYGGNVSEYFDRVEYIPLETSEQSLLGDVGKLIVTDSAFIIYDYDTNSILFFTNKGKFVRRFKEKKGVNVQLQNDLMNRRIIVSSDDQTKSSILLNYFDYKGKLTGSKSILKRADIFERIVFLNEDYYAKQGSCYFPIGKEAKDSLFYLLSIYKNDSLLKTYLPFNQKRNISFCAFGGSINLPGNINKDGSFYVATPMNHVLYKINKDTCISLYQLIFPAERTFPESIKNAATQKYVDSIREKIKNYNLIISVGDIFFSNNNDQLFFRIIPYVYRFTQGSEQTALYNFIYSFHSGKLTSLERMNTDAQSYFLPILEDYKIALNGPVSQNGFLYTSVSSLRMFSARAATKEKHPQYPPVLQQYFKTQNRKSNPVIVKLKLKDF